VALPLSGKQLKNLTTRLREGKETPQDLHTLADVLLYYQRVLADAHTDIERLCAVMPHAEPMAPRVKTLKTTLEKLHRQPELRSLAQIRDLAGMRVVVHGTRADQDKLAQQIAEMFRDDQRPVKLIDRRADPRAGYRAVHLEARREGILIEIQIRTGLQHRWAELFERAADKLGRGLRYGKSVEGLPTAEAKLFLVIMQHEADAIDTRERLPEGDYKSGSESLHAHLDRLSRNLEELL
jgi:ppGpp synthetase/RelA/SpoT-type nucleotidyltranferase